MMIEKFIITDPSLIFEYGNSFKNYKEKAWKNGGEVNSICLINRKGGGRAKLHKLAIIQNCPDDKCVKIEDRIVIAKSGILCIASAKNGWDSEKFGVTFETLEEAIGFFAIIQGVLVGFDSMEEATVWAKTLGDDVHIEERVTTVEVPREFLEVPCCNQNCPYASGIVNGICTIKMQIAEVGDKISVTVDYADEAEFKRKMDCVLNFMYEETGQAGKFERSG
jgi:hypothetical protein